jgi:hypothetical protein
VDGVVPPHAPLLWGNWHATSNPRLFIANCAACGAVLWLHRNGFDDWRATCANGCTRAAMDAGAAGLLAAQRARLRYPDELRATMETDDPFYGVEAEDYVKALTGREAVRGFVQCPFHGDGEERTPSLHVSGVVWHCQACKLGGTIYDFGAALYDIEPRREGFAELKRKLSVELLRGVR